MVWLRDRCWASPSLGVGEKRVGYSVRMEMNEHMIYVFTYLPL